MQTLKRQIASFTMQAVDAVLPPRCAVSGEIVERQGAISPKAWLELDFIAEPFCVCCGFPFEYEVDKGAQCTSCLAHTPPFKQARSALKYNEASRNLILGFKHADKTHIVAAFMPWLKRCGADMLEAADYVVPVPLHRWRLLSRRYNQSALIAQMLGRECKVPVLIDALVRTRATPSQGHLTAKERVRNVKRAFGVNPQTSACLKGKTVVLVDDVYTTGATVKECSKALLKAGAAEVSVLSLVRVVRDGEFS